MFLLVYNCDTIEFEAENYEEAHKKAIADIVSWLGEKNEGMLPGKPPDEWEIETDIELYEYTSKQIVDLDSYREKWKQHHKEEKRKKKEQERKALYAALKKEFE